MVWFSFCFIHFISYSFSRSAIPSHLLFFHSSPLPLHTHMHTHIHTYICTQHTQTTPPCQPMNVTPVHPVTRVMTTATNNTPFTIPMALISWLAAMQCDQTTVPLLCVFLHLSGSECSCVCICVRVRVCVCYSSANQCCGVFLWIWEKPLFSLFSYYHPSWQPQFFLLFIPNKPFRCLKPHMHQLLYDTRKVSSDSECKSFLSLGKCSLVDWWLRQTWDLTLSQNI